MPITISMMVPYSASTAPSATILVILEHLNLPRMGPSQQAHDEDALYLIVTVHSHHDAHASQEEPEDDVLSLADKEGYNQEGCYVQELGKKKRIPVSAFFTFLKLTLTRDILSSPRQIICLCIHGRNRLPEKRSPQPPSKISLSLSELPRSAGIPLHGHRFFSAWP
jgi:hypothetical protein